MSWAGRPAQWGQPGHVNNGTEFEAVLDQIDELTDMGWDSWTPAWTSTGTQPAIGNGSITGRYRMTDGGDLVHVTSRIVMGTTTTYGTGVYLLSVPVLMSTASELDAISAGVVYDASTTANHPVTARIESSLWRTGRYDGSVLTPTVPITFATGDIWIMNAIYEPA